MVGKCFLRHAEAMKRAYTDYCVNNDRAEQLLEKYEASPEVQRLLQKGVETLQSQVRMVNQIRSQVIFFYHIIRREASRDLATHLSSHHHFIVYA